NVFTLTAGYTSGATTVVVSAADGASLKPGDILRKMTTGEGLVVTANAARPLTVVPSVGAVNSAAGTTGDKLVFIGSSFQQGASIPDPKYSQRVLGVNYTQIFRSSWQFAGAHTALAPY